MSNSSNKQKTFVLPKIDWPPEYCFNICIGPDSMERATQVFRLRLGEQILEVRVGTTWCQLLDSLGLIGERGVFASKSRAEEAGWGGEITVGHHSRTLGSKRYKIQVIRTEDKANVDGEQHPMD